MTTTPSAGRVEAHGVDVVPPAQRHGRARQLFGVWAASNVNYLYLVLGGSLPLLGLDAWTALLVVVLGNAFWALVGVLAISGPRTGSPSGVIMRSLYGIRANRVNLLVSGWGVCVAYVAINLAVGSLAGFALLEQLGGASGPELQLAVVLVVAAVILIVTVYGHGLITRLSGWLTGLLVVAIAVLAVFVIGHADLGYVPLNAPQGSQLWAAALAGVTIIASGPLSWGTSADYARYLPVGTSPRAVAGWTALGGFLPATVLGGLGVLAGTAVDMSDPQQAMAALLPGWFYPVFLLVIVLGSITQGVLTGYSSGLALQAVGIRAGRVPTVLGNGAVALAITVYALFLSDFLDTLSSMLELSVALLGPGIALYATDIALRRNRYDAAALHDQRPGSACWYHHGINWAGVAAQLLGTGTALLCANTTLLVGPVASALGGADVSAFAGPVVAAAVYAAGTLARGVYPTRAVGRTRPVWGFPHVAAAEPLPR